MKLCTVTILEIQIIIEVSLSSSCIGFQKMENNNLKLTVSTNYSRLVTSIICTQ